MNTPHYRRTRVKICGITRIEDAQAAVRQGADAIGLVFYAPSPRAVEIEQAREIIASLPAFVCKVALLVDADSRYVRQLLDALSIDLLQFHGNESPAFCEQFGRSYIKAVRMSEDVALESVAVQYASASGLLLDSYQPGVPGGTGHAFDWQRLAGVELTAPLILAGGLHADNITQAIQTVHPYAVDTSSGVEQGKGIKDEEKIKAFMSGVNRADAQ